MAAVSGWFALAAALPAAEAEPPTRRLGLLAVGREAGLASGQVHAVAEDRRGLLWFALPTGLARFDGREIAAFGRESGLATQGLRALRADADGGLWIGSDLGLELRHPDGRVEPIAVAEPWTAGAVEELALAADGSVWVAAAAGVRRCVRHGACVSPAGFPGRELVSALAIARDGRVWLASLGSGLSVLEPDGRRVASPPGELGTGPPTALLAMADGGMIVGGSRGLVQLSATGEEVRRRTFGPDEEVPSALLAVGDELWVGTDRGLNTLLAAGASWRDLGWVLRGVGVNQLTLDVSDGIWIATDSQGALMASALRNAVEELPLPCATQVFSLSLKEGEVLVGGDQCSARLLLASGAVEPIAALRGVKVWDLLRARDGSVWAATEDGLLRSRPEGDRFRPVAGPSPLLSRSRALLEQGERLYVAGVNGLVRLEGGGAREILDDEGRSLGYVYTLARRGDGVLAGTLGRGLWSVEGDRGVPVRLADASPIANVYAVDCPNGERCAVVQDDQLMLLEDGRITRLEPSVPSPIAGWSVRFDAAGELWLGTANGLVRYRLPERAPRQRLSRSMGLPGEEFTTSRSLLPLPDGTLLCGLDGGLGRVRSRQLEGFGRPPTVELLESAWQDARITSSNGEVEVAYGRWKLDAKLFSPWRIDPQTLDFRYRLEGLEERWSQLPEATDRVRYSALPPGRYRLLAQASSPLTGPGPVAELVRFRVGAPWWLSIGFAALVATLISGAATWLWRWRVAALRGRAHRLEALVGQRTEDLQRANLELERLAYHDALTGLPNRRLFGQRSEEFAALATRRGERFGLALIDLDFFKAINDELGHDAGDEALRQVARTLEAAARRGDFLARLAGEEFVVLFAPGPGADFGAAAERLRRELEAAPLRLAEAEPRNVTASVGWSAWRPEGDEVRALLRRADEALYRAKRRRNWVEGDPAADR